jgi:hypothetical protein
LNRPTIHIAIYWAGCVTTLDTPHCVEEMAVTWNTLLK